MRLLATMKVIFAASALVTAGVLGAACSSETGGSTSSGGGDDTGGSSSSSSSSASSSSSGMGGAGGAGCGDTMTDPNNCGACGTVCQPGLACVAGVCGCAADAMGSLANDVQPIFTKSCVKSMSCHGPTSAGKLNLSAGTAFGELVNVASQCVDMRPLVTPGKPEESYLLNKVTGKDLCGGKKMPLNSAALQAADIGKITTWICAGALDN